MKFTFDLFVRDILDISILVTITDLRYKGPVFQGVNLAFILCDAKRLVDMTVTTVDGLAIIERVFNWTLSEVDDVDVKPLLHLEIIVYKKSYL